MFFVVLSPLHKILEMLLKD